MDKALRESSANWKIVVGHHTIKSAGQHGNTVELVAKLLPILEVDCNGFFLLPYLSLFGWKLHF